MYAYITAAIAERIAQELNNEELALTAAMMTAVADQLAVILVCRSGKEECNE